MIKKMKSALSIDVLNETSIKHNFLEEPSDIYNPRYNLFNQKVITNNLDISVNNPF